MKRRFLCALTALMLAVVPALAESGLISALETSTPAPTGATSGTGITLDGLTLLSFPSKLTILEGEALEAYEAAVQADLPDAAHTLLAAVDTESGAAIIISEMESELDPLDAAREAAEALISDPDAASEQEFGENRAATFACAIGEQTYRLFYLSDGERLLMVGASGLEQDTIDEILTGLTF